MIDLKKVRDVVDEIVPLARSRPHLLLEFVGKLVEKFPPASDLSTDIADIYSEIVPALGAAGQYCPEYTAEVMRFLREIDNSEVDTGPYANHKAKGALEEICSYKMRRPIESSHKALDELEEWLADPSCCDFAVELVARFLSASMSDEYADGHSYVWSSAELPVNDGVLEVRSKAMELVCSSIVSPQIVVAQKAISECRSIHRASLSGSADGAIWQVVQREKEQLLDALVAALERHNSFHVVSTAELLLLDWWCTPWEPVVTKAFEILSNIDQTKEYCLFKLLFVQDSVFLSELLPRDVGAELESAERRSRVVDAAIRVTEEKTDQTDLFTAELLANYTDPESLGSLLLRLANEHPDGEPAWASGYFFKALAVQQPCVAWGILDLSKMGVLPWRLVGRLVAPLRGVDSERWRDALTEWFDFSLLEAEDPIVVRTWVVALFGTKLSALEDDFVKAAIDCTREGVRAAALEVIAYGEKDAISRSIEIVAKAPQDSEAWRGLFTAIRTHEDEAIQFSPELLSLLESINQETNIPVASRYDQVSFLRLLINNVPQQFAEVIQRVVATVGRRVWFEGTRRVLSQFELQEAFEGITPEVANLWLPVLLRWAREEEKLADVAIECLANFCTPISDEIVSLASEHISSDDPVLRARFHHLSFVYRHHESWLDLMIALLESSTLSDHDRTRVRETLCFDIRHVSQGRTVGQPSKVELALIERMGKILEKNLYSAQTSAALEDAIEVLNRNIEEELKRDEEMLR